MTVTETSKGPLRYRLYYRLMDICLFFAALALFEYILDKGFGIYIFGLPEPYQQITAIPVLFFNFVVPLVLVVAKPLRDEYAEILWRRTLVVLGYFAAVGPFLLYLTVWFAYLVLGQEEPGIFEALGTQWEFFNFLQRFWMTFLLLFVGVFQFLRWRDSR